VYENWATLCTPLTNENEEKNAPQNLVIHWTSYLNFNTLLKDLIVVLEDLAVANVDPCPTILSKLAGVS